MVESKPRDPKRPPLEEATPVIPREPTLADKLVATQGRHGVDVFLSLLRKKNPKRRG